MNKTVLITGGATGIGKACVLDFASQGYDVIIHYNESEIEAKKLENLILTEYHVNALTVKCDLRDEEEIIAMMKLIEQQVKTIDVLVNNAAISIDTLYEDKTKENFMKTLEVNLVGTFLVSKYIGDMMFTNKRGKIINIASTNGIDKNFPMCLDYDASKAGLISLTHNLSLQYAPYIQVNAVAPGWIGTDNELKDIDLEFQQLEEEKIYVKRIGKPEEVAYLVSFLASSKADYINNSVIKIDGGMY